MSRTIFLDRPFTYLGVHLPTGDVDLNDKLSSLSEEQRQMAHEALAKRVARLNGIPVVPVTKPVPDAVPSVADAVSAAPQQSPAAKPEGKLAEAKGK